MSYPNAIAVLCASSKSEYKTMPGVSVYDKARDARSFIGGKNWSVIGHPPCRSWSAFCAHQAKPEAGERELGIWVVEQVRQFGGIIEQPAYSRLFDACGLPKPGDNTDPNSFTISVLQSWFGYPTIKKTWLWFRNIQKSRIKIPLTFEPNGSRKVFARMSKTQRSHTSPEFARWLVNLARFTNI